MAITEKNILKNWFVTGAKPTQEQFWAWLDSYWHKYENIPTSKIVGLDDLLASYATTEQLNNKANNDASNIDEFREQWRYALGVEDIPQDLVHTPELDNYYKIVDSRYLDPDKIYLLNIDGNAVDADSFGKNIGNVNLELTNNRTLSGGKNNYKLSILSPVIFGSPSQKFSKLIDKSLDATYKELMGLDPNGNVAKVNGKTVFKNLPSLLTEDEKTQWKTEMNGGWTTNTMSIGMITPVVIKKSDQNIWVTIRGVNLNVNPSHFYLQIIDSSGSNIVANIPNSQVQLYNDGLSMVFYYNFNNLPINNYKIRINNGVATHTSSMSFSLTEEVNIINTSLISWEKIAVNDDTVINANGGSLTYNGKSSNKAYANDLTFVAGAKSSLLFNNTDNFYIKLNITTSNEHTGSNGTSRLSYAYFGLVPLNSKLSLAQLTVINCNIGFTQIRARTYRINSLSSTDIKTDNDTTVTSVDVLIVRQNGIVYMVMNNGKVQKMALLGDYSGDYCLGFFAQNFSSSYGISVNIEEAYIF